jgi:DNA-binding NtrC family response regulator
MSKQHFLVTAKRTAIECADLGSTNGTFVNSEPIRSVALTNGSIVRAGDTLFVLTAGTSRRDTEHQATRCAATLFPILLQGETGTGKEVMARKIHSKSRRHGPFVPVNCATLSKELVAAEMFGHAKGAFSGATAARLGLFRAAEGGTLFLDEIGELPLELQSALLRVLEDRHVRPVGSDQEVPIDVRVICATHVDLRAAIREQRFRADLYARISHIVLTMPPLRQQRETILALASEFSHGAAFTANAAEALLLWDWPRNVRELRSVIEVAAQLGSDPGRIHLADLTAQMRALGNPLRVRSKSRSLAPPRPEPETDQHELADRRAQLLEMLEVSTGNVSQVALQLGKPRAQVYRWAKALGIDVANFRKS